MQINISGHHLDITDALRDYVDEKFAKLERHFDQITSIQVILSPEPKSHKAESTIHISGADVFATELPRFSSRAVPLQVHAGRRRPEHG